MSARWSRDCRIPSSGPTYEAGRRSPGGPFSDRSLFAALLFCSAGNTRHDNHGAAISLAGGFGGVDVIRHSFARRRLYQITTSINIPGSKLGHDTISRKRHEWRENHACNRSRRTRRTRGAVLRRDLPAVPGAGEVLIKAEAIGVNFIDTYFRSGLYPHELPFIIGAEV